MIFSLRFLLMALASVALLIWWLQAPIEITVNKVWPGRHIGASLGETICITRESKDPIFCEYLGANELHTKIRVRTNLCGYFALARNKKYYATPSNAR